MVSPATQTLIPQAHISPFTTHQSTDLFHSRENIQVSGRANTCFKKNCQSKCKTLKEIFEEWQKTACFFHS